MTKIPLLRNIFGLKAMVWSGNHTLLASVFPLFGSLALASFPIVVLFVFLKVHFSYSEPHRNRFCLNCVLKKTWGHKTTGNIKQKLKHDTTTP